jgi:ADP-ribosyl-[dinitrogen reductase] hydrolase
VLVELAVGDAYGAGFEYVAEHIVREHNDLSGYIAHPTHEIPAGHYTDDTQMSLAVAEALVDGLEWTPQVLAAKFVEVFRRDPRSGYAGRFQRFLEMVADGDEFLARIRPHSAKSGAAMRACPVGVLPDLDEVLARTRIQAAITHDTPEGIGAACAAALMPHYFRHDLGPRADLGEFLCDHVPGVGPAWDWATPWTGSVGAPGWMSVRAAVTAVTAGTSLSDVLRRCVDFTGDVDTVATIALAAGSCAADLPQDLPAELIDGLETGTYGRDYLAALDARLHAL